MSDFHPPINTLQEWNERLEMCGCCPMPECLEPLLECQSQRLRFCAFPVVETTGGETCVNYYKQWKNGWEVNGSYNNATPTSPATIVQSANYTAYRVERYDQGHWVPASTPNPVGLSPCQKSIECVIGGTADFKTYYYVVYANLDGSFDPRGPFIASDIASEIFDMQGEPDPRWTGPPPAPIINNTLGCAPMWRQVAAYYNPTYDGAGRLNGSVLQAGFPVTTWLIAGQCSNTPTGVTCVTYDDYSEPVDVLDELSNIASMPEETWDDGFASTGCTAISDLGDECLDAPDVTRVRIKWKVAPCHPGSYYKILWDEVFFPKEYLDWYEDALSSTEGIEAFDPNANPPPVLPTLTSSEWEWIGEALGDCDELDPENNYEFREQIESRISPWSESIVALDNGVTEIRNVKVICYRSDYGVKPQSFDDIYQGYNEDDVDQDGILDANEPIPEV